MLKLEQRRIFLCRQAVDMRKAFDALSDVVRVELGMDPFQGDVFIFISKDRRRAKVLLWEAERFLAVREAAGGGALPSADDGAGGASAAAVERRGGDALGGGGSAVAAALDVVAQFVVNARRIPSYQFA